MESTVIYLATYVLQQDMRIRLPKSILTNMNVKEGVIKFDIYFDTQSKELILKLSKTRRANKCAL
jgi:hypothetical protein